MFSSCFLLALGVCHFLTRRVKYSSLASSTATGECPTGNLEIPDGVTVIESERFHGCSTIRAVTLADSVKEIGSYAFMGCTNLQTVNLGNRLETIGMAAFCGCYSLESVTLPKSVTFVDLGAFAACYSLVRIGVDSDNEFFVEKSGALIEVKQTGAKLIQCPAGKEGEFRVPQFVSSIEAGAFGACKLITSVHLPEGITSIADYAFALCTKLKTVNLPDNLEYVGEGAFCLCYSLKSICLGSVKAIRLMAFSESGIETITIPESCEVIGDSAFSDMDSLVSVDFQNCRAAIGEGGFYGCPMLSDLFNMESLSSIGDCAFEACSSLTSVVIGDNIKYIGWATFTYCSSLSSVSLGSSVIGIADYAFAMCNSLVSLYVPKSVSFIGSYCFISCLSLDVEVDPENSYYSSSDGVFVSLSDSRLIRFPASRTGHYEVPESIISLGHNCFAGGQLSSLYIPSSVVEMGMSPFMMCSQLESITVDTNNMYFKAVDGIIFEMDESGVQFSIVFFPSSRKGSCVIPGSVSRFSEGVFALCQLESVTVPDSVTVIPEYAFWMSSHLKSVTLGAAVESIGTRAFMDCVSLSSIVIPDSVTSIGNQAFAGCSELRSIVIPDSVISVGSGAFRGCENLESVVLGESLRAINEYMFMDCHSLKSINIPNSVESIGTQAFAFCYSLTSIILGENVALIGDAAFEVSGLIYVLLPAILKEVGMLGFFRCSNLTTINFTGTVEPEIGMAVFEQSYNIKDVFVPADYDRETFCGLPVTKNTDSDITTATEIRRSLIVFLVCVCVFCVIEIVTSYTTSVKCRLARASEHWSEYSDSSTP